MAKTKIDVISGFLGAGKTTFIKILVAECFKGEQTVIIENEFGEIGIDGGFLKDSGIEIREMNSGCICCSLAGDFATSLKELLSDYKPDRIIIEPSGVGKLSDVLKAIADVESELEVESNTALTVVDVKKCKMYMKNFGEFFNNQIQFANTIVLSRTDLAEQEKIDEALSLIQSINPKALIVTTPIEALDADKLLEIVSRPVELKDELLEQILADQHHHHHQEHADGYETHTHTHTHGDETHTHEHSHDHHHEDSHHVHHHHDGEVCTCGCAHDHVHTHAHAHTHDHHHHHAHHHAEDVFVSWGLENVPAIARVTLEELLGKLEDESYGNILRAKGIIAEENTDKWLYFDYVPGEMQIRYGKADYTSKVCVIGASLDESALYKAFHR